MDEFLCSSMYIPLLLIQTKMSFVYFCCYKYNVYSFFPNKISGQDKKITVLFFWKSSDRKNIVAKPSKPWPAGTQKNTFFKYNIYIYPNMWLKEGVLLFFPGRWFSSQKTTCWYLNSMYNKSIKKNTTFSNSNTSTAPIIIQNTYY